MIVISRGSCPGLRDLYRASTGEAVKVDPSIYAGLDSSRRTYLDEASKRQVYGYCTGLGEPYTSRGGCGSGIEERVLKEHAVGVGGPARESIVRAFLFARLSQLAQGRAPIRGVVAERIVEALNKGIIPVIPVKGSVGASGDLAPSAHAFLCIHLGIGSAFHKGRVTSCREALEEAGLKPLNLEPGEALALINNTAWSIALAGLGVWAALSLLEESLRVASKSLSVTWCNPEHFSREVIEAKRSIEAVTPGLECSGSRLQDPYSIRCIPQVYGSAYKAIQHARSLVEAELCSSTENPLVAGGRVLHSCNFHSLPAGLAADYTVIALASVANIVERRIAQLLRSSITGRPEYLAREPGSVGAMILQYTAASLAARIRRLSTPSTVNSIPTSGMQEDHTPMSPDAGLKLLEAVEDLSWLIAVEDLVAGIALEEPVGDKLWRELMARHANLLERAGLGEILGDGQRYNNPAYTKP